MNTPPVTPREGTRRLIARTGDSCLEVLTPAKTDDFSRPSSIRLPKQGLRSPVTTFKHPIIRVDEVTLSPPQIKKRKSGSLSPQISRSRDSSLDFRRCDEVSFLTPPHRSVSLQIQGAPRKPRRIQTEQDEPPSDIFEPQRVLDFGSDTGINLSTGLLPAEECDWESLVDLRQRSSKDIVLFRRMISAIALAGLDIGGECTWTQLKSALLSTLNHEDTRRCLSMLRSYGDRISMSECGNRVVFPPSFSPPQVLRELLMPRP